jgi:hypothetical protein
MSGYPEASVGGMSNSKGMSCVSVYAGLDAATLVIHIPLALIVRTSSVAVCGVEPVMSAVRWFEALHACVASRAPSLGAARAPSLGVPRAASLSAPRASGQMQPRRGCVLRCITSLHHFGASHLPQNGEQSGNLVGTNK